MLNNISEFLRRIDQFGASYKPSYSYGEVQFKTSLGGLLSIVLYGLSLAYLIYELILWKSGRILPKITSLQTEIETYSLQFDKVTIASFCLRKHTSIHNQIDPFDPNNVIVLPMLYEILNDEFQEPQTLLSTKIRKHGTYLIEVKNIELSNNEHESLDHPNKEFLLVFQECTQDLLPEGWYCAKEDRIKTFLIKSKISCKYKHLQTNITLLLKIDIVEQDYYASFDNKTTYFSQIVIGSTNISIDTGFLLESLEIIEFPSSLQSYIQQMDLDYFAHSFQNKIFLAFEFELGTLQQTVYVEYPKVSEVLANIGSIVSFFLFFSHIAYMINEKNLELKVLRTLIEMYYPQMKEVTFKNCYGKVIQVLYKNSRVSISFLETYNKFLKIAQAKLCLTNQLYEVSRLQFILNSICDKQVFRDCHDIGIRLKGLDFEHDPDKHNNKPNIIKVENIIQQELKLENVENESIKELNITKLQNYLIILQNPKATIEMQSNQIQVEQLNQSQSLFLGKMIENQLIDEEDFKLSDEDFYVLMQHQSRIKELEYETVALQNQQQIQYEVQN